MAAHTVIAYEPWYINIIQPLSVVVNRIFSFSQIIQLILQPLWTVPVFLAWPGAETINILVIVTVDVL